MAEETTPKQREEGHLSFEQVKQRYNVKRPNGPKKYYFIGTDVDLDNIHPDAADALAANPLCKFLNVKSAPEKAAAAPEKPGKPQ